MVDTNHTEYTVSKMEAEKPRMLRRKRRSFSPEFKAEAVRLVLNETSSTGSSIRRFESWAVT